MTTKHLIVLFYVLLVCALSFGTIAALGYGVGFGFIAGGCGLVSLGVLLALAGRD